LRHGRGDKNANFASLKARFDLASIEVIEMEALAETSLSAGGWLVDSVRQSFAKEAES